MPLRKDFQKEQEPEIAAYDGSGNECDVCWSGGFAFCFCPKCGKADLVDHEDAEAEADHPGCGLTFVFGPK